MRNDKTPKELRELRKSKGISLRWVATELKISEALLCYMEQGKRTFAPKMKTAFLKAIGEL